MPDAPKRPGMLTFVAILLMIFGFFYAINSLLTGFYAINVAMNPEAPDPKAKVDVLDTSAQLRFIANEIPYYVAISLAFAAAHLIFAIAQIVLGINIMRLRPWARKATMLMILVRLLYILGHDAFSVMMIIPAQLQFMERNIAGILPPEQANADLSGLFSIVKVVPYVVFALVLLIEVFAAGLIILILNTTTARNAFAGIAEQPEAPPSEAPPPRSQYAGYEEE